ncbi:MAG TPA: hypothetical protein VEK57_13815 [Thermoanaerobaculia bacterium]|nr:hypothetical protein [Thermoanaerobaculia bacterium]
MKEMKRGIVAVAMLLVACGGGKTEGTSSGDGTGGAAGSAIERSAAADGGSSPSSSAVAFTEAELDGYVRGLRREIEAAQAAQRAAAAAATPAERGRAIQASWETATMPLGAAAAGLPVERYTELRNALDQILRTLDHQGKIDGPTGIDLEHADDATKARVARDPFADLPPSSAAALRSKLDAVTAVWSEYVQLTAVAG